jgi:hypothetical protein
MPVTTAEARRLALKLPEAGVHRKGSAIATPHIVREGEPIAAVRSRQPRTPCRVTRGYASETVL